MNAVGAHVRRQTCATHANLITRAHPRRSHHTVVSAPAFSQPATPGYRAHRSPTLTRAVAIDTMPSTSQDLLIVGPGVLGSRLGKIWKDKFPEAVVIGQTNSDTNHAKYALPGSVCLARHVQKLCLR